jgi:hypothetical protein
MPRRAITRSRPESRSRSRSRSPSRSRSWSRSRSQLGSRAESSSQSQPSPAFAAQLRRAGLEASTYLQRARAAAGRTGYTASANVSFAPDGVHKLQVETPLGRVRRFGRVSYGDYILWTHAEREGKVAPGYAAQKRHVFRASHGALSRQRGITDQYAPNNLAINILW